MRAVLTQRLYQRHTLLIGHFLSIRQPLQIPFFPHKASSSSRLSFLFFGKIKCLNDSAFNACPGYGGASTDAHTRQSALLIHACLDNDQIFLILEWVRSCICGSNSLYLNIQESSCRRFRFFSGGEEDCHAEAGAGFHSSMNT